MHNFRNEKNQLDETNHYYDRAKLKVWTECILPQVKERFLSWMLVGQWVLAWHEAEEVLLGCWVVPWLVLSSLLLRAGFSRPSIVQSMDV